MNELDNELLRVGLNKSKGVAIDENLSARLWTSEYAELYVVEALNRSPDQLNQLLDRLDMVVAERLRKARDSGRLLDAHVCIVADTSSVKNAALRSEVDSSRFVSRKYWIDCASPTREILERLTLAWVEIKDAALISGKLETPSHLLALRQLIAEHKGAAAATLFLKRLPL